VNRVNYSESEIGGVTIIFQRKTNRQPNVNELANNKLSSVLTCHVPNARDDIFLPSHKVITSHLSSLLAMALLQLLLMLRKINNRRKPSLIHLQR
jgi:hypothetical protein